MRKDEAAMALADAFITEYKKFDFRFPNKNNIQNSKWWIHFERAAELRYLKDWNPTIWVKCQFDKNGKILPFRLYGKKAEEAFQEYKHRYLTGKEDRERQIISAMLATYKTIKLWCKKNDIDGIDYDAFFEDRFDKYVRGQLSLHFLSICKPFMELYFPEDHDLESMKLKRAWVHRNKKLKNKLKEIMGTDFY